MCNNVDEFSFHYGGSKIICNVQNFATTIAEAVVGLIVFKLWKN
jgi:hypothetical protein